MKTPRWRRLLMAIRRAQHRTGALNVEHGQHMGAERVHSYWHGWWSARRGLPRDLSVFSRQGGNLWIVDWLAGWDDGAAGRAAVPLLLGKAPVGPVGPDVPRRLRCLVCGERVDDNALLIPAGYLHFNCAEDLAQDARVAEERSGVLPARRGGR